MLKIQRLILNFKIVRLADIRLLDASTTYQCHQKLKTHQKNREFLFFIKNDTIKGFEQKETKSSCVSQSLDHKHPSCHHVDRSERFI